MNKKVIVAIDSNNIARSKKLVKLLKKEVYAFKIGYEFFYNFGIEGYKEIKKICPKIFLDLKLHDIPNTVSKAIKAIEKLGPIFTTIHISGGDKMQNLSIKNRKKNLKILGVSILTSLDKKEINKYYNEKSLNKLVGKYVEYAKKNKLEVRIQQDNGQNKIIYQMDSMPLQKWNHIVMNFDSSTLDLFINNKLVISKPNVLTRMKSRELLAGSDNGFEGGIRNVTYFPYTLSKQEIELFYNNYKKTDFL